MRFTTSLIVVGLCLLTSCTRAGDSPEAALQHATRVLREGRSTEAAALAHAAAQQFGPGVGPEWQWRFRHLEAESLLYLLKPTEAAALVADALPGGAAFDSLRPRHAYLRAYASLLGGKTAPALAELPDISAQAQSRGLLDVSLDAIVLQAQPLLRQGQFDVVDHMLVGALERATDTVAYQRGAILLNLGMSRLVRNRFDEALTYFERVLDDRSIESTLVYRVALGNAGICYSRLGDFARAIAVQRRAVDGHERAGLSQYHEQSLGELGVTLLLDRNFEAGVASLVRALAIATANNQGADAAIWAGNLAIAYEERDDWDRAERYNEQAVQLKRDAGSTRLTYNIFNRARIAAGRGQTEDAVAGYEEAIRNATDDAHAAWMSHAGLAQVYRTTNRMAEATNQFELALGLIEQTRADLLTREYRFTFLSRLVGFHQSYVDALVVNGDVARALEVAEASRARVLAERFRVPRGARVSAAQFIALAARTNSVLLSYWLAPTRSFVWIVTGAGIRCVTLAGSQDIEPLVRRYRDLVTMSLADPLTVESSAGTRLTDMLLRPVLDAIPAGSAVVVVPDGALHNLNFDMLPVMAPQPHYWIEDVTVTVAPSLALAVRDEARPARATRSLLLIGDPTNADTSLPPLTFAGTELSGIERVFGGQTHVLRGAAATPSAVAESHPERFGLIHFAAHATANADSPLDSAILLSPPADSPPLKTGALEQTASAVPPTVRAAGHTSSYKLYARDVTALPLTADVVTLSACRSAGGRAYGGEGLVGFAWAFLRAGARQVVAGLWDVDDQSTALLMERYYERLATGATPVTALRQAKLTLLHSRGNFRKPYYWAAFTVFATSLDPS